MKIRRCLRDFHGVFRGRIHNGAEIDLVLFKKGRRIGVECKRADAPVLTPSMRIALADLKLDALYVVYPGEKRYTLAKKVEVSRWRSWWGPARDKGRTWDSKSKASELGVAGEAGAASR